MNAIDAVRTFLIGRYTDLLPEFNGFHDDYSPLIPGWINIDEDLCRLKGESQNGLLLDPKIGVAFFLIRYIEGSTNVRAQMSKAIAYRSKLLPKRLSESKCDIHGSWRVIIHWLVDEADEANWQNQVSVIRRDTSYLEELPVDCIVCSSKVDWCTTVSQHDLPRLLLRTRKVLAMQSTDTVFQWSNADTKVINSMRGFAKLFSGSLEGKVASQIEERLGNAKVSQTQSVSSHMARPKLLKELIVKDFRNIKDVRFYFSGEKAQSLIIHGPNGTGKSNLFEALEFALRGTSQRAQDFIKDPDVTNTKKEREYVNRYLVPFGKNGTQPEIRLNKEEVIMNIDKVEKPQLSGNFLIQEDTIKFANKKANELSAEVLGEFSGVADDVREYAESELAQVQNNLKIMLSRLGLDRAGMISKPETARVKVVEVKLRDVVSVSSHLMALLRDENWSWSSQTAQVCSIADEIQSGSQELNDFATSLGKLKTTDGFPQNIRSFLKPIRQTRRSADQFFSSVGQFKNDFPDDLANKVDVWGRWLREQQEGQVKDKNDGNSEKRLLRQKYADEFELLTRQGQLCRDRDRHFENLDQFLKGSWKLSGEQHCPTCDTDFSERGGIQNAVESVRKENNVKLLDLREKYAEVQKKLLELDKELQVLDKATCPLNDEDQETVRVAMIPHLNIDASFEDILINQDKRNNCIAWIKLVEKSPKSPQFSYSEDEDEQVKVIVNDLQVSFEKMEMGFKLPDAWKIVTNELKEKLASVLGEHLPQTLGGLWRELVMNLTPAPWQLLGGLEIKVDSRRGKQETRLLLDVKGSDPRLARYVLNKAESLSLGLAWFLVRYVCHGRFQHAVLSLDDPAYDMDQTTFRDFCRLMESLLRLHTTGAINNPLSMLIFLHQDERALDAARATGGLLNRLTWNAGEATLANSIRMYSEEHRHPLPTSMFDS